MWHAVPRWVDMVGGENLGSLLGGGQGCATGVGRNHSAHLWSTCVWRNRSGLLVRVDYVIVFLDLPKEGARGQEWVIWSSGRSQGWPELVV